MSPEISAPKVVRRAVESRHVINRAETEKRQAIIAARRRMNALDIDQGTSGNINVRHGEGKPIAPASEPYNAITAEKTVFLAMDGTFAHGQRPAGECGFHRDILRSRADAVRAQPTYATILAIMCLEIPAVHHMMAAAGSDSICCATYATLCAPKLWGDAVRALESRFACLRDHHTMIAIGPSLEKALRLAVEIETLARQYHGGLQIGTPPLLPSDEIERVRQKMAGYGHAKLGGQD